MTGARAYANKVIRMRKHLIRIGKSRQNSMQTINALQEIERWLSFYPKANDSQVARFLAKHKGQMYTLIPGMTCPAAGKLITELNQLTQSYE